MTRMVPLKKQSKKKQREYHAKQRGSWYGLDPVTRAVPSRKKYDRNQMKRADKEMSARYLLFTWLFQLSSVPESVTHEFTQLAVGVVDGIKDNSLIGTDIDDLTHQTAALRIIAHQAAFHSHGQLVDQRGVHKF